MIKTLNGDQILHGDFGALVACTVTMMTYQTEKLRRGTKVYPSGVPFFDDMEFYPKTIALHDVAMALFDRKSPRLADNAYYASTLAVICRRLREDVEREITMQYWWIKKFGKENKDRRTMALNAFRSMYPKHPLGAAVDWDDIATFAMISRRLAAEIMPEQHFLLADVSPKRKRNELMQRMEIPADYFDMPFRIEPMAKTAMRRACDPLLNQILEVTIPVLKGYMKHEITRDDLP